MEKCNYTFHYMQEGAQELGRDDVFKTFENYRTWKYIIAMLIMLGKTKLHEYKILDVGCGAGEKLRFLTELRARPENCYGIDISRRAIDLCHTLSPASMHFQCGSALELPYADDTFDIVMFFCVLECFDDRGVKDISGTLRRIMRPGGVLLVVDINEIFFANAAHKEFFEHVRCFNFSTGELEQLLSQEFSLFRKVYINGGVLIGAEGQRPDLKDLPCIDALLDRGTLPACFSLYCFVAK